MAQSKSASRAAQRRKRRALAPVLIICAANTARSIMAEHMLRRELGARGAGAAIEIRSAGIAPYARDGALVSLDTRMALQVDRDRYRRRGDLNRPQAASGDAGGGRPGDRDDRAAGARPPRALSSRRRAPVFTLRAFADESGDIEDPFEKGDEMFDLCRDEIERLIPRVADRLLGGE